MSHGTPSNRLLQILLLHSAMDLFKYKSFFLLIFVLALLDRLLKKIIPLDRSFIRFSELKQLTRESAEYVFERLPQDIWQLLTDCHTRIFLSQDGVL